MFTRLILVAGLVLIPADTGLASELQLYTNRTTWNTDKAGANADLTFANMTFESVSGSFATSAGLLDAVNNVRYVGLQSDGVQFDLTVGSGFNGTNVLSQLGFNGTIDVTLPAAVRAFGVGWCVSGP